MGKPQAVLFAKVYFDMANMLALAKITAWGLNAILITMLTIYYLAKVDEFMIQGFT